MSTLEERFWAKVNKTDGCWLWTASKDSGGYGQISTGGSRKMRKLSLAHRVAFELCNGKIPNGMCVLHRCDTPACVRADHLFLGTYRDNTIDMYAKGRANSYDRRGERNSNCKLTPEQVRTIKHLYFAERRTQLELAQFFKVGRWAVHRIITKRSWI